MAGLNSQINFREKCRDLYSEKRLTENSCFKKPPGSLDRIYIDGFNVEQIWEQVNQGDESLLNIPEDIDINTNEENYNIGIAKLEALAENDLESFVSLNNLNLDSLITNGSLSEVDSEDNAEGESEDELEGEDDVEGESEDELEGEDDMGGENEDELEEESEDELEGEDENDMEGESEDELEGEDVLGDTIEEDNEISSEEEENDSEMHHKSVEDEEMEDEGLEVSDKDDVEAKESDDGSSDSDDSAYDELDRQLYNKYLKADSDEEEEEESDVESLAVDSAESDDEDASDLENDDEEVEENAEEDSDEENRPKKKSKKEEVKSKDKTFSKPEVPDFAKTSVDSLFLNLRESEWVADEDLIGRNNLDDIDLMEDIESDNETDIKYDDFFDNPNKEDMKDQITAEDEEDFLPSKDTEFDFAGDETMDMADEDELDEEVEEEEDNVKSTLQMELEKEMSLREQMEKTNISSKPWMLKGEVQASDRPTNSTLSEMLHYKSGKKLRPDITDAVTMYMDRMARDRFRTRTFNSVERKAKLVVNPFEYKKALVLDQEKSTKSLSQIYEEEYMRKQRLDKAREEEVELPEHKEVRELYEELEGMLNALSNAHFTPKEARTDLKVVSNLPAIAMEETTPIAVAEADQLAPQEIMAPLRGELKGDEEKTETDKKRERRLKKKQQHHKYKEINKKTDEKIKKSSSEGKKLDVNTSGKIVQKALKTGHVKMLDKQGGNVKSSQSFFTELNEAHKEDTKKNLQKKRKRNQIKS